MAEQAAEPLELWGGIECTIARIGDQYRDQIEETGHGARPGDIDLMASLGLKRVRYPILWERVAPDHPKQADFAWFDERLEKLRERGIAVTAGLVHHGSGPSYTNLLDPEFPQRLADYAARVAERYPWIDSWTPVNEPLTTARFAALYGHWYPHRRDPRSFARALVNQCLATRLAMAAIRRVNPEAQLLQTEDLGKTFATAPLAYQARHENERRWISLDLLCGRVGRRHRWHRLLTDWGIGGAELELLGTGEAAPDLLGINHYLTSERFLDHRVEQYDDPQIGGNGRDTYVDAEAVRVKHLHGRTGLGPRLGEAWRRYRLPMALAEVHHGCTRDEQLRWFAESWRTATELREAGMDLRAVTLWSLFGNVDWRSLLTRQDQVYDVGVFDARPPEPRPTILAAAAAAFGRGEAFDHPVLDAPGWWRRPSRLYRWNGGCRDRSNPGRRMLVTGATGTLGQAFARIAEHRGLPACLTTRDQLDLADDTSIERALDEIAPWAVVNAAGFVRVADAEQERDACMAANADGPERLARACARRGIRLVTFSSDLVFDGTLGRPCHEGDPVSPGCIYGHSKAEMERRVLHEAPDALVLRTSAFFGPWDRWNFAWSVLAQLAAGGTFRASRSVLVSPTFVPDLVHASLDLLIDGEAGIWHLANQGRLSWHEFASRVARGAGYDPALILPFEEREAETSLASRRGMLLRPLDAAISDFLAATRSLHADQAAMAVAAE